jgi:hypothetical protein
MAAAEISFRSSAISNAALVPDAASGLMPRACQISLLRVSCSRPWPPPAK